MSKSERESAQRRKRAADPGQPQKTGAAKPTYVSTDKPKMKSVKESIEFVTLPLNIEIPTNIRDFNLGLMFRESLEENSGMLFIFDETAQQSFHMTETRIPLDIAFITEDGIIESIKQLEPLEETPVSSDGEVLCALEVNRGWFEEHDIEVGDEIDIEEGKKDACYHKVKSRYSVWPSAYASGALVKCRKVGAANWGNKSKKEETEYELDEKCWKGYEKKGMKTMFGKRYPNCVKKEEVEFSEARKPGESPKEYAARMTKKHSGGKSKTYDPMKDKNFDHDKAERTRGSMVENRAAARAAGGYKDDSKKQPDPSKKGFTGIGNMSIDQIRKMSARIEKEKTKKEEVEQIDEKKGCAHNHEGEECPVHGKKSCPDMVQEAQRIPQRTGNIVMVLLSFRGRMYSIQMFFPSVVKPSRAEVQDQIEKVYPGGKVTSYQVSEYNPGEPLLYTEDWQSVNRKDKTDGLSQKAVDAYRRENPGSKLKTAVTTKPSKLKKGSKSAKRRKSFCSRMKGMKKRLTSAKTARDPDSRINKALRRWNC